MRAANRPLRLTLYAMLGAILYLPGLGRPRSGSPTKAAYAEIAREMVLSGDYVTPRDDFELYLKSPRSYIGRTPHRSEFSAGMNSQCDCPPRFSASGRS